MNYWRYIGVLLGLNVLVGLILWGLEGYFNLGSSAGSGAGVAPVLGAAMLEGTYFAKANRRLPEKAEKRLVARGAVLVHLVLFAVAFVWGAYAFRSELQPGEALPLLFVFVIVTILLLLLIYWISGWSFEMGAKTQVKADEKKQKTGQ